MEKAAGGSPVPRVLRSRPAAGRRAAGSRSTHYVYPSDASELEQKEAPGDGGETPSAEARQR